MTAPDTTRQAEAVKLLPCPFCGTEARLLEHDPIRGKEYQDWAVRCKGGMDCPGSHGAFPHPEKSFVKDRWNRRAAVSVQDIGDDRDVVKLRSRLKEKSNKIDELYAERADLNLQISMLQAGSASRAEPVAWVRFCSDGCYEGPIMDCDRRMDSRRESGAWTPLYTRPLQVTDESSNAAMPAQQADSGELVKSNAALQEKIDALMLEYCPDQMSDSQLENWASHQKRGYISPDGDVVYVASPEGGEG